MSELNMRFEIDGADNASPSIKHVETSLSELAKQAQKTGAALKANLGGEAFKALAGLKTGAESFGTAMTEAATRGTAALRTEIAAATELRGVLREAAETHARIAAPPRAARTVAASSGMSEARAVKTAASARAKASRDAIRDVKARWAIRDRTGRLEARQEAAAADAWSTRQRQRMTMMNRSAGVEDRRQRRADRADAQRLDRKLAGLRYTSAVRSRSERIEQQEADWRARAEASGARQSARTETMAADRRIRDAGRTWRVREQSEAAEVRHVQTMRREREGVRRHAAAAGRQAVGHASHAVRSINHPVHESLGFALTAGAAAGGAFAEHVVRASEAFDTSMARLRMFAPALDADAIRKQALADSVALGVDASKVVDVIAKSVRDGVPTAIAASLPKSIVQTAQVMGGDIERLTDSLAEGIQESTAMGWIKDKSDARRFLNLEAGLSTTAGNTSEKTEQFVAAGGLGHGREMGLDLTNTMAYGAILNASGSRTGQSSARFMGQLSQNTPKMVDKYRQATESHKNTEEDRAVRSAPRSLGYGGIREMQSRIMAGPEGLIDFAVRLQKLDDKTRKLTLEGYGFSEQGGAMLAELGSNDGTKGKAVLARAKELANQKESNDYLSEKFSEWSKSLAFTLQQIEAGWKAIENEIGDVFKTDLISPFRDWWVDLSSAIVGGGLRERVHGALLGFVHGLGFDDFRHVLDSMTAHAHGFDLAGFARGVGEGVRAIVDNVRQLGTMFGVGGSGISAETVGRLATEFLGLSAALRLVSPVANTIGGIASSFLALKAAIEGVAWVSRLAGITGALGGGAGAAGGVAAAGEAAGVGALAVGVLPVTIAAVTVGAIAVAIMNWRSIVDGIEDVFAHFFGGGKRSEAFTDNVRQHARAAVGDDVEAQKRWVLQKRPQDYDAVFAHHGRDGDGISTPEADREAARLEQLRPVLPRADRPEAKANLKRAQDQLRSMLHNRVGRDGAVGDATGEAAERIKAQIVELQRQIDPSQAPAFANGGLISGAGGGRSDSIVARVSNGEFVMNAAATARNLPILEALNSGRLVPMFSTGGIIGGPTRAPGIIGGSTSADDTLIRAMVGTDRGVAGLRDGLALIAELLRDGDSRSGFGRGAALLHGEVQPADTSVNAVRAFLSSLQVVGGGIRAASAGADLGAGLGIGQGRGAPNLRYGRGGDGGRGGDTRNVRYGRNREPGGGGRYRGTPIPDAPYNGKTIDGLSDKGSKQFAAILGKRESGNRYGIENAYGYVGRWQMGADALAENGYVKRGTTNRGLHNPSNWTGKGDVRSVEDFKANKGGVQDTEFGEYTNRHFAQLKAAGVIREGMPESEVAGWLAAAHLKGVGGAKQLARGHDNVDANGTSASSYRRMMAGVGSPGDASGTPEAVDPDVTKRLSALNQPRALKDEECVTLAMKAVGITKGTGIIGANVHDWRKGEKAEDGNLQPGTAVSTFLDRHGREADSYAAGSPGGGGTRGAHLDHAAVFEKYVTDAAGKKIGMQVAEQFKGSGGIRHRSYMFRNGAYGEGDGSNYHAVKTADGKYLGGANNPMTVKVAREHGDAPAPGLATAPRTAEDVARRVPTADRPTAHRDADAPAPAASERRADAGDADGGDRSVTLHNVFHVHGAHDPHHTARTIGGHLSDVASRYTDHDVFG